MSKGDIHINVSGGSADFDNIAIGDKNKLQSKRNYLNESLQDFYDSLDKIHESQGITEEQLVRLKKEVEILTKDEEGSNLADRLKSLYKNYSWAIDPIKKLITAIMT